MHFKFLSKDVAIRSSATQLRHRSDVALATSQQCHLCDVAATSHLGKNATFVCKSPS